MLRVLLAVAIAAPILVLFIAVFVVPRRRPTRLEPMSTSKPKRSVPSISDYADMKPSEVPLPSEYYDDMRSDRG